MRDALQSAGSWLTGGDFTPAQRQKLDAHEAEGNQRRLRLILPLMSASMLLLAAQLGPAPAGVDAQEILFRHAMGAVYLVSALGGFVLTGLVLRGGPAVQRELPLLSSLAYLVHVCAVVGLDQLYHPKITVYAGACMGIALLVSQTVGRVLLTYGVGLVAYSAAILAMQSDPDHRVSLLRIGVLTTSFCCVLAVFLVGARRRDFRQTLTIEEQREELEDLNRTLEDRVARQVEALTRRTEEVERLNRQLQDQVKDRSRALTAALRRLAQGEAAADDLEGRVVGGRFAVGARIAAGGMGAVYEGLDTSSGDEVAVKVIRSSGRTPLSMLERFLREAETVATVAHPAVVRMLHVDIEDDGTFYQVQELVRGETLQAALKRAGGRMSPEASIRVLATLAEALAAAHAKGVVHRDVKPANIMLTRDPPGLKLLDFGISKLAAEDGTLYEGEVGSDVSTDRHQTRAGAVMGTPQFMSPEQQEDASGVTDRADVFALGVVAGAMLLGDLPSAGSTGAFEGLVHLEADVRALLGRCLHGDPLQRPSAEDLHARLSTAGSGGTVRPLHHFVAWDAMRGDTTDTEETVY